MQPLSKTSEGYARKKAPTGLAQQLVRIVRPFPARGFLGDAFDIFQETHRGDLRAVDFVACFQRLAARRSSISERHRARPAVSLWWSGVAAGLSISFSLTSPIRTSLRHFRSPFPGNGILGAETAAPKRPVHIQRSSSRDKTPGRIAASWALFARHREISVCVGLGGGAGRTRTSSQTIISR